ncbi:T9SS type A sorting domain-containing protein [Perlabentimonas gracilis]|uniref:T9SS type A sorting domain-containing protein n=1 Tax=Perlabentimonas gracilis TaxID=2715279 RepID=UPI001407B557|nr:T9SS type A sorting domain-containing protein [Perlabentimonas gracilis]NHB69857.1 T9SS type A sorting domain-containing protein [Perlabentimonas gracilis]
MVKIEAYDDEHSRYLAIPEWDSVYVQRPFGVDGKSINLVGNSIGRGNYRIVLENVFKNGNNTFQSGHSFYNFEVKQRAELAQFIEVSHNLDCNYSNVPVNLYNNEPGRPKNITLELCDSEYNNCNTITDPTNFNVSPGTYYLKAYYNESPVCVENIPVTVTNKYPQITINGIEITYGCPGHNDIFKLSDNNNNYDIIVGDGSSPYLIKYKVGSSPNWYSPGSEISSEVIGNVVNNEVTVTVGVFVGEILKCSYTKGVTYTPRQPIYFSVDKEDVRYCNEANNGKITLTTPNNAIFPCDIRLNGGNPVKWNDEQSPFTIDKLSIRNYTITLTDNTGCVSIKDTIIDFTGSPFSIKSVTTSDVTPCSYSTNGQIIVTVEGDGSDSFQVSKDKIKWDDSNTISNLGKGTHTVWARPKEIDGCKLSDTVFVDGPKKIIVSKQSSINPSCNGSNDGSITLKHTPSESLVTYQIFKNDAWENLEGNQASDLSSRLYIFRANDDIGCESLETEVFLSQPDPLTIVLENPENPKCHGENGSITFSCSGGTPGSSGYNYAITGNNGTNISGSTLSGKTIELSHGDYTLSIVDEKGCSKTEVFSITEPPKINFNYSLNNYNGFNIKCNGGVESMQIDITGGTPFDNGYKFTSTLYPDPIYQYSFFFHDELYGDTNYTFTAEDKNGCEETHNINLSQPTALTFEVIDSTNPTCSNHNDGEIEIEVSGGVSPYFFNLLEQKSGNTITQTSPKFTTLSEGIWYAYVNDTNECKALSLDGQPIEEITLTVINPMSISIDNTTMPSCHGDSNGSIEVTLSGRNEEDKLVELKQGETILDSYSGNSDKVTFSGLSAGNYTILFTEDSKVCSVSKEIVVEQPEQLTHSLTPTNATCFDSNTGKVKVAVTGGNKPYIISLVDENISPTQTTDGDSIYYLFENLQASNYQITLTDAIGCSVKSPDNLATKVNNPPTALVLTLEQQPAHCFETETGKITAEASGGWDSYSFSLDKSSWYEAESSYLFTHLGAASHAVYLRDAMGCEVEQSIEVEQPLELTIDSIRVEPVACHGGSDGTIEVFASGGNGGYEYDFGNGFVLNSKQIQLIADEYTVTVKDSKGCEASQQVSVPQPDEFTLNIDKNIYNGGFNISCHGLTDTVWLTPRGATAPYAISVNSNPVGYSGDNEKFTIENLAAGTHAIIIVDANGCEYEDSFSLSQPQPLSFDQITATQPKCHNGSDGSINIESFSGGSGLYNFNLLLNGGVIQVATNETSFKFEGLASGEYKIMATDTNGCSIESDLHLGEPTPVVIDSIKSFPLTCKGDNSGSILAFVSGGVGSYQYQWYNASFDLISSVNPLEGQPAGLYYLRVKDGNGCWAINPETNDNNFSKSIEEPAEPLAISSLTADPVTCNGQSDGRIWVSSTGGWGSNYTYSLNGGTYYSKNPITGTAAGNHMVSVRDSLGCTFTDTITVTQPNVLSLNFEQVTDIDCHGNETGEVTLKASGGNSDYAYGFSETELQDSPTFNNLSEGSHTFWVVDSKGCSASNTLQIAQPEPIGFTAINIQHPHCGDSNGSFEIQPLGGNAPFNIEWTSHSLPSSMLVSGVEADFYQFNLTDSKGCSNSLSFALSTISGPTISSIDATEPTCHYRSDGAIEVSLEGETSLMSISLTNDDGQTWVGTSRVENIPANLYYLKVTDIDGCSTLKPVQLDAPEPIVANLSVVPVQCLGEESGSALVELSGGTHPYSAEWYNHMHTKVAIGLQAHGLGVGNYYASITDANGCGFTSDEENTTSSIEISEPQEILSLSIEQVDSPVCAGGTNGQITLAANGGWGNYQFSVNNSSPSPNSTLANISAGNHEVSVIDMYGCKTMQAVTVTDPLPVIIDIYKTSQVKCAGGNDGSIWGTAINGTSPYSYSINNSEVWNNHGIFNNLTEGIYAITAKDINNCVAATQVSITQPEPLQVSVASLLPTYCGTNSGSIHLNVDGGVEPYAIQWEHLAEPSGLTIGSLSSGIYTAHLTDANGCNTQITLEVPEVDGPMITSYSYTPPLCHDSSDGQLMVDFTGVSSPFYFYLNGQQIDSPVVEGVAKGNHQFVVMDEFGCSDTLNLTIDGPQPIALAFDNVVHPQCFDYSNGSFEALATGATPPFTFEWSHGVTGNGLENLSAGLYSVLVSDIHGCAEEFTIQLNNPAPIETDLPEAVALCQGQSVTLDAQNPSSMHWWVSANGFESFQQVVTIWDAGEYHLQVTNDAGCFKQDTIRVTQHDYEVNSTLLVPSTASVGDTIVIIDISWPVPDNIEWIIPSEFTILVDNPYDKQLIPDEEGVFSIELISTTGECLAHMAKSITVSGFNQPKLQKGEVTPNTIISVTLAPNPANRHTLVDVALLVKAEITIELINSYGLRANWAKLGGADSYSYQMPLNNMSPGIYLVRVTANGDQKAVRLIVL